MSRVVRTKCLVVVLVCAAKTVLIINTGIDTYKELAPCEYSPQELKEIRVTIHNVNPSTALWEDC